MTVTETVEEGMFQTENPIHELNRMLVRYDLTPNQSKVYLFLSKIGVKTASEISKALKIPRTETYHLLSTLQQKGIIFSVFGKPTKFNAAQDETNESFLNVVSYKYKKLINLTADPSWSPFRQSRPLTNNPGKPPHFILGNDRIHTNFQNGGLPGRILTIFESFRVIESG